MNSSKWSEVQKIAAGKRFASRLTQSYQDPAFRTTLRRDKVAVDLSIALAESGQTRQAVADKAGIKISQLSRQLAGDTNLTLDSLGKICEAIGCEFDVVLRQPHEKPALQSWQRTLNRINIVRMAHESEDAKVFQATWINKPTVVKNPNMATNEYEFTSRYEAA